MRLIIAGGREFSDYGLLCKEALKFINAGPENVTIISGLAKGADTLACNFAAQYGFALEGFAAEWRIEGVYIKSAGIKRNKIMAKEGTHLLAFWDGKSRGTMSMIDLAHEFGLILRVVEYG